MNSLREDLKPRPRGSLRMSRIAMHVYHKYLYISLPSSAKQNVKYPNDALSEARELRRLIY